MLMVSLVACSNDTPTTPIIYPQAESAAARLFLAKCNACHGAPQPSAHLANIWPGVIQRMQMHMQSKGISPLTKDELSEVLDYLQRNAADVRK